MLPRFTDFLDTVIGYSFFVPDYAFMQSAAILIGIYLVLRRADHVGFEGKGIFLACLVVIVFALVCARLCVILQFHRYYLDHPVEVFDISKGGTASTGAYIGGMVGAVLGARWQRLSLARFLDCCAPSVALAIVLGRVGCFLNGCCYGQISEVPWAMRFPEGSGPHFAHLQAGLISQGQLSLPVHPTQLYEAAYAALLFLALLWYRGRQQRGGELFAFLFVLYPIGRFVIELFRADERGSFLMFSIPQLLSIVAFTVAVSFLMKNKVFAGSGITSAGVTA